MSCFVRCSVVDTHRVQHKTLSHTRAKGFVEHRVLSTTEHEVKLLGFGRCLLCREIFYPWIRTCKQINLCSSHGSCFQNWSDLAGKSEGTRLGGERRNG